MCLVLKVTHLPGGEELALKLLLPETAISLSVHARFVRDAQSAARLHGEHTARIVDVGVMPDGVPYLVTQLVRGVDLAGELARRGPLTPGEVVDYILQVCESLAEAHAHGIVHGAIKPGHVLLTARPDAIPHVTLAGFGVPATAGGTTASPAGAMGAGPTGEPPPGAPEYLAPEQLKATAEPDPRTDIWALGVVLYECLAGVRPFEAPSPAALARAIAIEPPHAMDFRIPGGLQTIVLRCLEKNREARFTSVATLATALVPFAYDQHSATVVVERVNALSHGLRSPIDAVPGQPLYPVVLPPSIGPGLSPPPSSRRRAAIIAIAALAVSIGGIAAASLIRPGRSRSPSDPPQPNAASSDAASPATANAAAVPSAPPPSAPAPGAAPGATANTPDKARTLAKCTELAAQRAWQALDDCGSELGRLGALDDAEQFHAAARQELKNVIQAHKVEAALADGNFKDAQLALQQITAGSVYLAETRDLWVKAEQQGADDARRKARALAGAHDCAGLRRLVADLGTTSTERVAAAAQAVDCDDERVARAPAPPADPPAARPDPPADPPAHADPPPSDPAARPGSSPPTSPPARPSPPAASPAHGRGCDTVNVDDVMTRAAIQYDAGAASSALSLARVALACKQTDRMYWLAVLYACAAHDAASARLYFAKVPANLQSGLERKCQQDSLDVRGH